MKTHFFRTLALLLCVVMTLGCFTACQQSTPEAPPSPTPENTAVPEKEIPTDTATEDSADLVFMNGHIQTLVSEDDVARAVAVKGNEIVYVGDDEGALALVGDNTQVIDLEGRFMAPGFMDGHIHSISGMLTALFEIDLNGLTTKEEYLDAIAAFVEAHPDDPSYFGSPFMLNAWQEADGSNPGPNKTDLDKICPDKPIVIYDVSHHSIWTNSAGLELGGVDAGTPTPQGGSIAKDENGEPTGYLTDAAANLVTSVVPPIEYTDEMYREAMLAFEADANARGITGVADLLPNADLWRAMEAEGELTLRLHEVPTLDVETPVEDMIALVRELKDGSTNLVTAGTVKIFYDGVTESATAVMLEPYLEAAGQGGDWYGEPVWDTDTFNANVAALDAAGIQVHVHAIGDGAVKGTLNAYEAAAEANGARDARHTITHVCAITDEDIRRMADLDVIAALQFVWMYADPLYELEAAFIGTERAQRMYPVLNMKNAGILISGASDGPVTSYDTREEMEVGVTRNSPYPGEEETDMHRWAEQGLTAYEMLEAYSKNVAYQNFLEDTVGTIEVGKKADLVVLDYNILECAPEEISDVPVICTVSDGRIVFQAED